MKETSQASISCSLEHSCLELIFEGDWLLQKQRPSLTDYLSQCNDPKVSKIQVSASDNLNWDTSLVIFIRKLKQHCIAQNKPFYSALPDGIAQLITLADAVPPIQAKDENTQPNNALHNIGKKALGIRQSSQEVLTFVGEVTLAFGKLLRGRVSFRKQDFGILIEDVGPKALGIVSLISFLLGVILAYMGAVQLGQFGAQIYIADLVGIGMVREMAALMTGIILAGRTGAAYAAQLGTMQVNEEIDAYRTLGISPMEFLVLPRILALMVMVPFLIIYADLVGVISGFVVAMGIFDIGLLEYYNQTLNALTFNHFIVGLIKGCCYGILVALCGCYQGIKCGRSASAVGQATTRAIVFSIIAITIAASILTILFQQLGI